MENQPSSQEAPLLSSGMTFHVHREDEVGGSRVVTLFCPNHLNVSSQDTEGQGPRVTTNRPDGRD